MVKQINNHPDQGFNKMDKKSRVLSDEVVL